MIDVTGTPKKILLRCPCCGQALDKPVIGIRAHPQMYLSPMQQALFNLVKSCPDGIASADIRERIYSVNRNGDTSNSATVRVMANRANKKLAAWGLVIRAGKGCGAVYRLVRL